MKPPHESLYRYLTRTYQSWQVFITSDHAAPQHGVDVVLMQRGRHDFSLDDPQLLQRLLRLHLFIARFRVQYAVSSQTTYVGIRFAPIPWLLLATPTA